MSIWAMPGVKCVCIHEGPLPESQPLEPGFWTPVRGEIYTISRIEHHPRGLGLVLKECPTGETQCFSVRRFRPLITRTQEQDMKIFHPLLKVKENA